MTSTASEATAARIKEVRAMMSMLDAEVAALSALQPSWPVAGTVGHVSMKLEEILVSLKLGEHGDSEEATRAAIRQTLS